MACLLECAQLSVHTQVVMTARARLANGRARELAAAVDDVPDLLGLPGQLVTVSFRGRRCTAVAEQQCADELSGRPAKFQGPITDVVSLELISGSGEQPSWVSLARVHAIIETGRDAVRTVHRASRWASYAARVAVVPEDRLTEEACLEASLRGVWVVAAGDSARVAVSGQRGAVRGSARGLLHRLLDEVVADVLRTGGQARKSTDTVRSESS